MELPQDFVKALTTEEVDLEWMMKDSEPAYEFDHKPGFVSISDLHSFLPSENHLRRLEPEQGVPCNNLW